MLAVNGLYGHVARNNLRSLLVFAGFAVAFQIICMVLLTPFLLFFDSSSIWFIEPVAYFSFYGLPVFVFGSVYFALNFLLHTRNIKTELGVVEPGPAELQRIRRIVEPLATTAGISPPRIAILETNACNAFVCGWRRNSTTLVITRGLLKVLNNEELSAVIAHEVVHIKNDDIKLMAFANVAVQCIKMLEGFNIFKINSGKRFLLLFILFPLFMIFLFLTMIVNFTMLVGTTIGRVSRLLIASSRELIADAEAVRLTHDSSALISALLKIEGRSTIDGLDPLVEAMMIDGAAIGEFATHPTIAERIRTLRELTGAMALVPTSSRIALPASSGRMTFARNANATPRERAEDLWQAGLHSGSERPVFGMLGNRPFKNGDAAVEKSLIGRVNADAKTNMFGLPPRVARILTWVFIGMLGMQVVIMFAVRNSIQYDANSGVGKTAVTKQEPKPLWGTRPTRN